jgi:hypothetical protein
MELQTSFKEMICASMWCADVAELRCSHSVGSQIRGIAVRSDRITPIKNSLFHAMLANIDISPFPMLY